MKTAWGIIVGISVLLLSACGNTQIGSTSYKIGDQPADEYYKQFLYRKVDKDDLPYRYLGRGFTKLRKLDAKSHLFYSANLYLLENGTYVFDYSEWQGQEPQGELMTMKQLFQTRKRGTWKVSETSLQLEMLGTGSGLQYNGEPAVVVKFERPLNAPELKDRTDLFLMAKANQGMTE